MPNSATTRSKMMEQGVEAGLSILVRAGIVLIFSLICLWVAEYLTPAPSARYVRILGNTGMLVMAGMALYALSCMMLARKGATFDFACPYCNSVMRFTADPVEDFDCEKCHRRVYFENGIVAPVRDVACEYCKSIYKVSTKAHSYLCDNCNRPLKLHPEEVVQAVVADRSPIMMNYEVVLTEVGRNRTEVAMALESIMICNMNEAHAKMDNLPIAVITNVSERKADMVRRRLRELGATVNVRPMSVQEFAPTNPN